MSVYDKPYGWANIQRYFPKEEVARMRKQLLEERATGKYTDRDLMRRYRMSKQTFYNTVQRYRDAKEDRDYKDKSKAPKNPAKKLTREVVGKIQQIVEDNRANLGKGSASL